MNKLVICTKLFSAKCFCIMKCSYFLVGEEREILVKYIVPFLLGSNAKF